MNTRLALFLISLIASSIAAPVFAQTKAIERESRGTADVQKKSDDPKRTKAEDTLNRAKAYARQDKLDLAIDECNKALSLKKDYHEAYNWRGICYETKKEFAKAFSDYDKAVALQPSNRVYIRNRGDMHYELKRYEDAWSDYNKAVGLEGKDHVSYFKRANASYMQGKFTDAIDDYTKCLELKPDFENAKKNREVAIKKRALG